jgi:collagen type XIV alpha
LLPALGAGFGALALPLGGEFVGPCCVSGVDGDGDGTAGAPGDDGVAGSDGEPGVWFGAGGVFGPELGSGKFGEPGGVPGVLGVPGAPGVPGVFGVPGVLGVLGVPPGA